MKTYSNIESQPCSVLLCHQKWNDWLKKYLRNAAIVSIGGQDEGKNARITQRIVYLSHPSQKEKALRDILDNNSKQRRHYPNYHSMDKILIFVNEKKHADGVSRIVERIIAAGRNGVVVLHGGKTQEQREEALDSFKRGGVIMVATDVAGRGLDIPNVTHVINYDLPQRSNIDAYCHRIGRTGRAGKDGFATSFLTDEDESIMPALVSYLKQTKNHIPDRLAKHPSVLQNNERPHTL
jgi:ATP-dependent RNA helicase DDX23/PRP28